MLFLSPIVMPPIVTAVALFYLFAQMGLVATNLGMPSATRWAAFRWHRHPAGDAARLRLAAQSGGRDAGCEPSAHADRITVPLVSGGLFAAFIFAFLHSFEELTIALFIGGGLKTTLPRQMWDDILLQVSPTLAAASVVVLVIVTACS